MSIRGNRKHGLENMLLCPGCRPKKEHRPFSRVLYWIKCSPQMGWTKNLVSKVVWASAQEVTLFSNSRRQILSITAVLLPMIAVMGLEKGLEKRLNKATVGKYQCVGCCVLLYAMFHLFMCQVFFVCSDSDQTG